MTGLFDRLKGAGRQQQPSTHLTGNRNIKIAGADHYHKTLKKVVKANPEHQTSTGAPRVAFTATLVPQTTNPHDANAVAVYADGRCIGHLSREDAAAYRSALDTLAASGAAIIADGLIYAGHKGGANWSVGLTMPTPTQLAAQVSAGEGGVQ